MMSSDLTFLIDVASDDGNSVVLKVGFNPDKPATNEILVKHALAAFKAIDSSLFGKVVKINGPASLPVAMCLAHCLGHICRAVAAFDPKMNKFVVCISHDPVLNLGDLID